MDRGARAQIYVVCAASKIVCMNWSMRLIDEASTRVPLAREASESSTNVIYWVNKIINEYSPKLECKMVLTEGVIARHDEFRTLCPLARQLSVKHWPIAKSLQNICCHYMIRSTPKVTLWAYSQKWLDERNSAKCLMQQCIKSEPSWPSKKIPVIRASTQTYRAKDASQELHLYKTVKMPICMQSRPACKLHRHTNINHGMPARARTCTDSIKRHSWCQAYCHRHESFRWPRRANELTN